MNDTDHKSLIEDENVHHNSRSNWQFIAFITVLVVYLFTRLQGLEDYPIFFFTDEAVQSILASDLIRDGWQNYEKDFMPTFFQNNAVYNLSLSVYLQVIPSLLFERTPAITRAASVLTTLLAAIWVGLIGRDILKISNWWLGPALLSITPAWFLHSRTAFETVLMVSFYAGFLYYYLLYRLHNPRYLYLAFLMGALALYSYMGGLIVIPLTFILMLLFDLPYHWRQRATLVKGLLLLALLSAPLLRFLVSHPGEILVRMARYQSFMLTPTPFTDKLLSYLSNYFSGLNPLYWFFPNNIDLVRHQMNGYGHVWWFFLPFTIIGMWLLAKHWWRGGAARPIFAAILAIPIGAAMVGPGITRLLSMVLPLTIACTVGLEHAAKWAAARIGIRFSNHIYISLFTILVSMNGYMLFDALKNGPLWSEDYGLHGMQYGAIQVFDEIETLLALAPQTIIDLSPNWTNGADVLARYFMGDPIPIQMRSIQGYMDEYLPIHEKQLFIMTAEEYEQALKEPKFTDLQVDQILPYPDGRQGFYFIQMRYSENATALFAEEQKEQQSIQESTLMLFEQMVLIHHTGLDMGEISHVFDSNPATLVRTAKVNPLEIILEFEEGIIMSSITLRVGGAPLHIAVALNPESNPQGPSYSLDLPETPNPRAASIALPAPQTIQSLRIQVINPRDGENTHVHLWDIEIK
jgi:hypothetical protein